MRSSAEKPAAFAMQQGYTDPCRTLSLQIHVISGMAADDGSPALVSERSVEAAISAATRRLVQGCETLDACDAPKPEASVQNKNSLQGLMSLCSSLPSAPCASLQSGCDPRPGGKGGGGGREALLHVFQLARGDSTVRNAPCFFQAGMACLASSRRT